MKPEEVSPSPRVAPEPKPTKLEQQLVDARRRYDVLQAICTKQKATIDTMTLQLKAADGKHGSVTRREKDRETKMRLLEDRLQVMMNRLHDSEEANAKLKLDLQQNAHESRNMKADRRKWEDQVKTLENKLEFTTNKAAALEKERDSAKSDAAYTFETYKTDMAKWKADFNELQAQLSAPRASFNFEPVGAALKKLCVALSIKPSVTFNQDNLADVLNGMAGKIDVLLKKKGPAAATVSDEGDADVAPTASIPTPRRGSGALAKKGSVAVLADEQAISPRRASLAKEQPRRASLAKDDVSPRRPSIAKEDVSPRRDSIAAAKKPAPPAAEEQPAADEAPTPKRSSKKPAATDLDASDEVPTPRRASKKATASAMDEEIVSPRRGSMGAAATTPRRSSVAPASTEQPKKKEKKPKESGGLSLPAITSTANTAEKD
eukprot:TRINITY_DN7910_c0_g1_i1.p1 TRINITY_DN7910_c0_g1~~TRINITY_DN7910_c0_g1_i1.p1  ORF type:complete len:472 (+),score=119.34 TRINITY_DN7910_c0_g1_i1:117-1418(+)